MASHRTRQRRHRYPPESPKRLRSSPAADGDPAVANYNLALHHVGAPGSPELQGSSILGYEQAAERCRAIFAAKHETYGASWLLFRPLSVVDQIMIKAMRIRHLETIGTENALVHDDIDGEYAGIHNYAIICVHLLRAGHMADLIEESESPSHDAEWALKIYDAIADDLLALFRQKNHDYNAAWRHMELSSITDDILIRTARLKTILRTGDEGDAATRAIPELYDAAIYASMAMIRIAEGEPDES